MHYAPNGSNLNAGQESSLGPRALRDRVMSPSILRRLSHHSIIKLGQSPVEMIVMVVQPQPVGGKVARWHYVPDSADVLPADVSPLYRGYQLQLTCSLLNGDGPHTDGTWEKEGKRRRKRPK